MREYRGLWSHSCGNTVTFTPVSVEYCCVSPQYRLTALYRRVHRIYYEYGHCCNTLVVCSCWVVSTILILKHQSVECGITWASSCEVLLLIASRRQFICLSVVCRLSVTCLLPTGDGNPRKVQILYTSSTGRCHFVCQRSRSRDVKSIKFWQQQTGIKSHLNRICPRVGQNSKL